jgi:hypothetical protein
MAYHKGKHKFIEFCFICNDTFVPNLTAWESHCQEHLNTHDLPTRCNLVNFRNALACPGRCLTCMYNTQLPASRRLFQFKKQVSWEDHVNECVPLFVAKFEKTGGIPCPDPGCGIKDQTEKELWYHLRDTHSYPCHKVKTKTKKQTDAFVHSGTVGKNRRHVPIKADGFDLTSSPNVKLESEPVSYASTPIPSFDVSDLGSSLDSSGSSPSLSVFDDNEHYPDYFPPTSPASSLALSVEDVEIFGEIDGTVQPSSYSPLLICAGTDICDTGETLWPADIVPDWAGREAPHMDLDDVYTAQSDYAIVNHGNEDSSQVFGLDDTVSTSHNATVTMQMVHPEIHETEEETTHEYDRMAVSPTSVNGKIDCAGVKRKACAEGSQAANMEHPPNKKRITIKLISKQKTTENYPGDLARLCRDAMGVLNRDYEECNAETTQLPLPVDVPGTDLIPQQYPLSCPSLAGRSPPGSMAPSLSHGKPIRRSF